MIYALDNRQWCAVRRVCEACKGCGCPDCHGTRYVPDWERLLWVDNRKPFRVREGEWRIVAWGDPVMQQWYIDTTMGYSGHPMDDVGDDGLYALMSETCGMCGGKPCPVCGCHCANGTVHRLEALAEMCEKRPHIGGGHLHNESDDGDYLVDGMAHCGRCHGMAHSRPEHIAALINPETLTWEVRE